MRAPHPLGHLRLLIFPVVLVLAAALLLLGRVHAQNAPVISGSAAISIAENTATTHVLETYMATDADSDPLTWTLEGVDAADFTLTANSGSTGYELKFAAVPDREMPADMGEDNVYNVTVKVEDDESPAMFDEHPVTITVTDVNEPPAITSTGPTHTAISKDEGTATSEVLATLRGGRPGERRHADVDAERRRRGGLHHRLVRLVRRAQVSGCSRLRKPFG